MKYSMYARLKHNSKSTKFGFSEGYPRQFAVLGLSIHMDPYAIYPIYLGPGDFPEKHFSRKPARKNNTWLSSVLLSSPSDSLISERLHWSGALTGGPESEQPTESQITRMYFS